MFTLKALTRRGTAWSLALCLAMTVALPALPASASARGGYHICNRTSEPLSLAIAYYSGDSDFFVSEGWWNLNPGGCTTVFTGKSYDSHRYYYAETKGKATVWTSENGPDVCIDPQRAFTIAHADESSSCPSPYVRQRFHFFRDVDLDLTAAGTPAAPTAPTGRRGACLMMLNMTDHDVSFAVDGWSQYWTSSVDSLEAEFVSLGDVPIKSSTGDFTIRGVRGTYLNAGNMTWEFQADETHYGCNGAWLVTFR